MILPDMVTSRGSSGDGFACKTGPPRKSSELSQQMSDDDFSIIHWQRSSGTNLSKKMMLEPSTVVFSDAACEVSGTRGLLTFVFDQ